MRPKILNSLRRFSRIRAVLVTMLKVISRSVFLPPTLFHLLSYAPPMRGGLLSSTIEKIPELFVREKCLLNFKCLVKVKRRFLRKFSCESVPVKIASLGDILYADISPTHLCAKVRVNYPVWFQKNTPLKIAHCVISS